jgi:hypothetical protein
LSTGNFTNHETKGFNDKWLGWVHEILSSGTSEILLNGVPGKKFVCKRGVRQCDPLSPLLYSFGSDLLQSVVNDCWRVVDGTRRFLVRGE